MQKIETESEAGSYMGPILDLINRHTDLINDKVLYEGIFEWLGKQLDNSESGNVLVQEGADGQERVWIPIHAIRLGVDERLSAIQEELDEIDGVFKRMSNALADAEREAAVTGEPAFLRKRQKG